MFLVNVSTSSFYETVYAESVPAVMELLAPWTVVVQGAAIGQLAGGDQGQGRDSFREPTPERRVGPLLP